ncbi:RING finger protein [Aquisphaera insulae]|uniref:RING finger protein n=1 Tax=Aquisphaera insulae TaxID=2712864 RepID=UPI0013E9A10F|nr:RING finger protein [Aquisphaera insulae]
MEILFLALIVLFIYALIRLMVSFGSIWQGARFRAYRQLAARYQGRYESRGLSDPPTVSFTHHGTLVRVGLAPTIPGQSSIPRTRVVARFPRGIPFRLELAPVSRPAPAQAPKGTRLVRSGSSLFDHDFLVQANDAEMARDFLNEDVREAIGTISRLVHQGGMLVSINPERLLVQVDRNLGQTGEALIRAVREALVIHDGLQQGVRRRMSEGISIVNAGTDEQADGPPLCKVCGEPIEEDAGAVACTKCETPHHRDCWEYVGSCSIYGCGCKFARPVGGARR